VNGGRWLAAGGGEAEDRSCLYLSIELVRRPRQSVRLPDKVHRTPENEDQLEGEGRRGETTLQCDAPALPPAHAAGGHGSIHSDCLFRNSIAQEHVRPPTSLSSSHLGYLRSLQIQKELVIIQYINCGSPCHDPSFVVRETVVVQ